MKKVGQNPLYFVHVPVISYGHICALLWSHFFLQKVAIPMGTCCAPILSYLLLPSTENDFVADLLQKKENRLAR